MQGGMSLWGNHWARSETLKRYRGARGSSAHWSTSNLCWRWANVPLGGQVEDASIISGLVSYKSGGFLDSSHYGMESVDVLASDLHGEADWDSADLTEGPNSGRSASICGDYERFHEVYPVVSESFPSLDPELLWLAIWCGSEEQVVHPGSFRQCPRIHLAVEGYACRGIVVGICVEESRVLHGCNGPLVKRAPFSLCRECS